MRSCRLIGLAALRTFVCTMWLGCSSSPGPAKGHVVVAITVDWEGAYISPEGLDALRELRAALGPAPLTHFVSAAYFTKDAPDRSALTSIQGALRPGDELAVHLHAWESLAKAAKIEPRLSPSYVSGTDQLLDVEDDRGLDIDLDAYELADLRRMLRTSRTLLAPIGAPISRSFRAGGYLGTPKVLQAIRDEGYEVDSSAIDPARLPADDAMLATRLAETWPDPARPPWHIAVRGGSVLEVPIAAIVDDTSPADLAAILHAAHARLKQAPSRDVFVVLAMHQETADQFALRVRDALALARKDPTLAGALELATIESIAARAGPP